MFFSESNESSQNYLWNSNNSDSIKRARLHFDSWYRNIAPSNGMSNHCTKNGGLEPLLLLYLCVTSTEAGQKMKIGYTLFRSAFWAITVFCHTYTQEKTTGETRAQSPPTSVFTSHINNIQIMVENHRWHMLSTQKCLNTINRKIQYSISHAYEEQIFHKFGFSRVV